MSSEPDGLNCSLDELIRKRADQSRSSRDRGGQGEGNLSGRINAAFSRGGLSGGVNKRYSGPHGFQHMQRGGTLQRGGFVHRGRGARSISGFGPHLDPSYSTPFPAQPAESLMGPNRVLAQNLVAQDTARAPIEVSSDPLPIRLREQSGDIIAVFDNADIVRVSSQGEVVLNTGGIHTARMLRAMNEVLNPINIKVTCYGDPRSGDWRVSEGSSLIRFQENMRLPAKGVKTINRATIVRSSLQSPEARVLALQASQASSAAAASLTGAANGLSSSLGVNSMPGLSAGTLGLGGYGLPALSAGFGSGMPGSAGLNSSMSQNPGLALALLQQQQQQLQLQLQLQQQQQQQQQQNLANSSLGMGSGPDLQGRRPTLHPDVVRRLKAQGRLV